MAVIGGRINISVPVDLLPDLERFRGVLNFSAICSRALRREFDEHDWAGKPSPGEVQRLRADVERIAARLDAISSAEA